MNAAAAAATAADDDDEAAAADDHNEAATDEVAFLLDYNSCSSLNESTSTPNDKGSVDAEPSHIWTNLSYCSDIIFTLPLCF